VYTFMGGLWAVVVTDYVQFVILTLGVAVLFPLVFAHLDWRAFLDQSPAGFFSPVRPPFSLLYVAAFYLLVQLSYNGNWAFAQKFYSVRDERAARKAGLLATVLKVVGPPLFVLPAMAARQLMPELMNPPNSPQYAYAALSLRFLPAGLMGLMIAAMFSATMSTLSGDYNVIASVITEDIYRRLFDKNASQRRLVIVGRTATLLVGAATVGIGVILVSTARRGLFEIMVTLFSLFVAPMLIPMLAGLLTRRVTWRGAAAGITCGFATAFGLYLYKLLVLAHRPGIDPNWLRYDFEALNILANFAVTITAMIVTTMIERVPPLEQQRIAEFFAQLDTPISPAPALTTDRVFSPFYIIGWVTAGIGVLLIAAAVPQSSGSARAIDLSVGGVLFLIAFGFYALNRRFVRQTRAPRAEMFHSR